MTLKHLTTMIGMGIILTIIALTIINVADDTNRRHYEQGYKQGQIDMHNGNIQYVPQVIVDTTWIKRPE